MWKILNISLSFYQFLVGLNLFQRQDNNLY